jgi:hypothetical protein
MQACYVYGNWNMVDEVSVANTLQTDQTVQFMVYISKYTLLFGHNSTYFNIL